MPTTLERTLRRSADSFLLLPGAEWVTYLPRSGSTRRIRAVVVRTPVESMPAATGSTRPVFDVTVKNDSADGISSDEVDTGGDRLKLAPNVNERPRTTHVLSVVEHNAGTMVLRVQG